MTAQASAKKTKSHFGANYWQKVWANRKIMIVLFVLHMLAAPLVLFQGLIFLLKREHAQAIDAGYIGFNQTYVVIAVFATALAVLGGVLVAISVFQYLYKKSKVDMYYSLPMTSNQRFFSDFFAGLTVYILPFLAASVFSVILSLICQYRFPKEFLNLDLEPWHAYRSLLTMILILIASGIVLMLMVYVFTVITLVCCGSLFEVIAYTLGLNVMIPGTLAAFAVFLFDGLYGVQVMEEVVPIICRTSPIGGALGLFASLVDDGRIDYALQMIFVLLGVAVLIGAVSWLLYRTRKAEHTGKPFVFKGFYFFLITCLTFCISCLFTLEGSTEEFLVPLIIVSAVVYLILELITNRGFKKFWKCLIHYGITIAAVLGLIFISQATDGFGVEQYIPKENQVSYITLNFYSDLTGSYDDIKIKEPENIKTILMMHKEILGNWNGGATEVTDDYDRSPFRYGNIEISYKIKGRGKVLRRYGQPMISPETMERLLAVLSSDEVISQITEFRDIYGLSLSSKDGSQLLELWGGGSQTYYIGFNPYLDGQNDDENYRQKFLNELKDALKKDLLSRDKKEFFSPSEETLFILNTNGDGVNLFTIFESDRNVLNLLGRYQIDYSQCLIENALPEILNGEQTIQLYFADPISGESYVSPYADHSMKFDDDRLKFPTRFLTLQGVYSDKGIVNYLAAYEEEELFLELLKAAQPVYYGHEPVWVLRIGYQSFIIPPEQATIAEDFYQKAALSSSVLQFQN